MRTKLNLDDELARQSRAAKAPMTVRNGVLLFVPKSGAAKPGLRIVNELRDGALTTLSDSRSRFVLRSAQGAAPRR